MAKVTYDLNADTIKKNAELINTELSNIDRYSKELETLVNAMQEGKNKIWWSKRANSFYKMMHTYITNNYKYMAASSELMEDLIKLAGVLESDG